MNVKRFFINIVKYLLIVVFVYYYIGNTAFIHTHIVHTYLITHSHPFLPGMHHSHSQIEFETLSLFNALCMDMSTALPIVPFILFFLGFIYSQSKVRTAVRRLSLFHLRSPPFFSFVISGLIEKYRFFSIS